MRLESESGVTILELVKKERSIVEKYRKGKLKSTPKGESKDSKLSSWNQLGVFFTLKILLGSNVPGTNRSHDTIRGRNFQLTRLETRTEEFNGSASHDLVREKAQLSVCDDKFRLKPLVLSLRPERW